jgi:hypothetical protein
MFRWLESFVTGHTRSASRQLRCEELPRRVLLSAITVTDPDPFPPGWDNPAGCAPVGCSPVGPASTAVAMSKEGN